MKGTPSQTDTGINEALLLNGRGPMQRTLYIECIIAPLFNFISWLYIFILTLRRYYSHKRTTTHNINVQIYVTVPPDQHGALLAYSCLIRITVS